MTDFPDLHHSRPFDPQGLRAAGCTQVILKATEGASFTDPTFEARWVAAKAAGLNRGAYHFARWDGKAADAARRLYSLAHDSELRPVLDYEDPTVPISWARDFLTEADQLFQVRSLLYMPQSWTSKAGLLVAWPLWAARYNWRLGSVKPWPEVAAWQYTDKGRIGPHFGDCSHAYTDLGRKATPKPQPPVEEDEMPRALRSKESGATFVVDFGQHTRWKVTSNDDLQAMYLLGGIHADAGNVPATVSSDFLSRFRDISA